MDLALNNLQRLICRKITIQNKTKFPVYVILGLFT